jgi:hypothetical protein
MPVKFHETRNARTQGNRKIARHHVKNSETYSTSDLFTETTALMTTNTQVSDKSARKVPRER